MKHFLVYTNPHKDRELQVTKRICRYLEERGQRVSVKVTRKDWEGSADQIDCMLVLGGDGTMLQAVRETRDEKIPLIGVNMGSLGYLTEIELSGLEEALDRLIASDYEQESRMMLETKTFLAQGKIEEGWALNDVVISRKGSIRVICFRIYVNGQFLNAYHADGVIVTTPTGSTGYNLSAGGPLVEPSANLLMVTPICPHTLNQRSIILSPEDEIEIEILEDKEGGAQQVEASLDGAYSIEMHTGDRIRVTRSSQSAEFLRLSGVSFLEVLRRKMSG